jgi:HEAT repeat protein
MKRAFLPTAVLVAVLASAASAESVDVDSVTIGAMIERSDVVVVADASGEPTVAVDARTWTFRVTEALRPGDAANEIRVVLRGSDAAAVVRPGASHVLFLTAASGGAYRPIAVPWGVRDATDGAVKPLVDYARRYAAALGPDGAVAKPGDLAGLLVESLASPANGLPSTAGRDLVRHQELVEKLTPAQRQTIDAALARPRKGDLDLASIIDAVGVAGTSASDEFLVARLLDPATRHLRLNLTAALRRHARPELVDLLARRLVDATDDQRADLVNALGRLGLRAASTQLVPALRDASSAVRVEAAHSLGLLARVVREPKPGVDVEAPREKLDEALPPLTDAVAVAKTEREKKSLLWALAQIDTADAWTSLKALRDESTDGRVRELAAEYVLHPRVELILE